MHRGHCTSLLLVLFFSINISCGALDDTTENINARIIPTTHQTLSNVTYISLELPNVSIEPSKFLPTTSQMADEYYRNFKDISRSTVQAAMKPRQPSTDMITEAFTEQVTEEITDIDIDRDDVDTSNANCDIVNFTHISYENSINVTWDNCNTSYNINLYKTVNDGPEIPHFRWLNESSYYFQKLEECTAYNISIEPTNGLIFETTIRTLPERPQNLTSSIKNHTVTFNWDEPLSNECKKYKIMANGKEQSDSEDNNFESKYNVDGCTTFEVALIDGYNNPGQYLLTTVPGIVINLTVDVDANSMFLSWLPPEESSCIVGYIIIQGTNEHNTTATEYELVNLEACTAYTVQVKAYSDTAFGDVVEITDTTTDPTHIYAVRNMRLDLFGDALRATWDPPNLQSACITSYGIIMWNQHHSTIDSETTNTSYEFTSLVACMQYNVMVKPKIGSREGVSTTLNTEIPPIENTAPIVTLAVPSGTSITINLKLQDYSANMCNIFLIIVKCTVEGNESEDPIHVQVPYADTQTRTAIVVIENLRYFTSYHCYAYIENTAGISNASDALIFQTLEELPSAPQNLTAIELDGTLLVTWEPPESIPGILKNYRITLMPTTEDDIPSDCYITLENIIYETTELEHRYDNAMPYYKYTITVAAETGAGFGPEATAIIETGPKAPEEPRNASIIYDEEVPDILLVRWLKPCNTNGKLKYFEYELIGQQLDDDNEDNRFNNISPNINGSFSYELVIESLKAHFNYTLKLVTYVEGSDGDDIRGDEVIITNIITPEAVPSAPQSLSAIEEEDSTLLITWEQPESIAGRLRDYMITITSTNINDVSPDCYTPLESIKDETDTTEYRYYNITPYYKYTITVAASTGAGFGPSASTVIQTHPKAPEAPRNVHVELKDASSMVASWLKPCNINGKLKYFLYELIGQHLDDGTRESVIDKVPQNTDGSFSYELIVDSLKAYFNYTFKLVAYVEGLNDGADIRGEEVILTNIITPELVPSAPQNLTATENEDGTILITWEPPESVPGRLRHYKITIIPKHMADVSPDCDAPLETVEYETDKSEYEYFSSMPYYKYTIAVAASTGAGYGIEDSIEIQTEPKVPEAPSNVTAEYEVEDNVITLTVSWSKPCNINGNLKYFECVLIGQHHKDATWYDSTDHIMPQPDGNFNYEHVIHSLHAYFNYTVRLVAYVEGVNDGDEIRGNESVITNITTPELPPTVPVNLNAIDITNTSFNLYWDEPQSKNGILLSYRIVVETPGPIHHIPEDCSHFYDTVYNYTTNSSALSLDFDEALPHFHYIISVAAATNAGYGDESWVEVDTLSDTSQMVRKVSHSFDNKEDRNYDVSVKFAWLLPCNTNGHLKRFDWDLVGTSIVDSTQYNVTESVYGDNFTNIDYSLTISQLLPLYSYRFVIATIVGDGDEEVRGEEYSTIFESPDGYPTEPTNLKIIDLEAYMATIVWDRPEHENGEIVSYKLIVTSDGPAYNIPDGCSTEYENLLYNVTVDPQIRNYAIQGRSNFYYKVVLLAKTRTGEGPQNELQFQTIATAPEPVGNVRAVMTDIKTENYSSKVEISFNEPCELNDNFNHYAIEILGKRNGYIDDNHNFKLGYDTQSFQLSLKPQYTYSGHIDVVTTLHTSSAAIDSFVAPSGVPPFSVRALESPTLTPTTATLVLNNQLFNDSQGDVIYYAIIVSVGMGISEGLGGNFDFWNESEWPDSGFWSPYNTEEYQTTPAFWAPFQDTRSANYTFVIGIGNCSTDNSSYCNGPLKPETQYAIRIRGYTSNAYRDTGVIYFTTPSEETYLALILGLIFGLLAAIMLLTFIFFLWCRRKKKKTDTPTEETVVQVGKPPPISKHRFVEHCLMFEENRSQLKAEYSHLDRLSATEKPSSNVAMADNNKRKNRYINIMPYDETRVRLTIDSNDNYEDYINASYIKGYSGNHEYIATQGPMESTVEDFWRMIIQEDVGIIVMVAQFVEQSKQKCFKYFPEKEEIMSIGSDINVKCTNEINLDDYINRTLIVEKDGEQMLVKHLQYMLWPDFGCPTKTSSMLEFRESMRKHIETSKNKAVIHCSAGVGRTGTLIAIDILLQKIDNTDDDVDVFSTVLDLRKQRTHMVQTEKQYEFIHKCLRDYLTKPKLNSDDNLSPIYENVNIINGYSDIIRSPGPHTSTENLIRLKEL